VHARERLGPARGSQSGGGGGGGGGVRAPVCSCDCIAWGNASGHFSIRSLFTPLVGLFCPLVGLFCPLVGLFLPLSSSSACKTEGEGEREGAEIFPPLSLSLSLFSPLVGLTDTQHTGAYVYLYTCIYIYIYM